MSTESVKGDKGAETYDQKMYQCTQWRSGRSPERCLRGGVSSEGAGSINLGVVVREVTRDDVKK